MGFYIDPPDMTKEAFLSKHGTLSDINKPYNQIREGFTSVILIFNHGFTAAGIAFDETEYKVFTNSNDNRMRLAYEVPTELLEPYCSIIQRR